MDCILTRRHDFSLVSKVEVLPSEECAPQHNLLVYDLQLKASKPHYKKTFTPKLRVWKLKDPGIRSDFVNVVENELHGSITEAVQDTWDLLNRFID